MSTRREHFGPALAARLTFMQPGQAFLAAAGVERGEFEMHFGEGFTDAKLRRHLQRRMQLPQRARSIA